MSEKIVQLNEVVIKSELKEFVRGSVEETLNELLEAEANKLTQAARYERNEQRQGYRSGHYNRNLTTTFGDVTLKVPKLKGISFETAIIERYRRRESSVEEALIEMYLAGVSVRRVEDITEALWGSKVSPSTISELNKKAYTKPPPGILCAPCGIGLTRSQRMVLHIVIWCTISPAKPANAEEVRRIFFGCVLPQNGAQRNTLPCCIGLKTSFSRPTSV